MREHRCEKFLRHEFLNRLSGWRSSGFVNYYLNLAPKLFFDAPFSGQQTKMGVLPRGEVLNDRFDHLPSVKFFVQPRKTSFLNGCLRRIWAAPALPQARDSQKMFLTIRRAQNFLHDAILFARTQRIFRRRRRLLPNLAMFTKMVQTLEQIIQRRPDREMRRKFDLGPVTVEVHLRRQK